jgi:hypothetical protein
MQSGVPSPLQAGPSVRAGQRREGTDPWLQQTLKLTKKPIGEKQPA